MENQKNTQPKVAEYDKYNYDYTKYWEGRSYEHEAEFYAIQKLFGEYTGKRIIDVGGSFGRLLPTYYSRFDEVVIIDYSLNTLLKYEAVIHERFPNAKLVAANVYSLPFIENSFDGAIMVRVLHHIREVSQYYSQLRIILTNDSQYLQEFANKMHLKAVLKWLFKFKIANFSHEPFQQEHTEQFAGTKGESSVFLNFHPKYIQKHLSLNGFEIVKKRSCSFLRIPSLKRLLSSETLMKFERLMQNIFSIFDIAPSIFFLTRLTKVDAGKKNLTAVFEEILACPACKCTLQINDSEAHCLACKLTFKRHSTVWDLRHD